MGIEKLNQDKFLYKKKKKTFNVLFIETLTEHLNNLLP